MRTARGRTIGPVANPKRIQLRDDPEPDRAEGEDAASGEDEPDAGR